VDAYPSIGNPYESKRGATGMTPLPDKYLNQIICGDALGVLREMPSDSVQSCVTSPPYWGLRDYGVDGQLGIEHTPEEYVCKLVEIFREVRRILRDDGVLFLNLGDSYYGSSMTGGTKSKEGSAKWKNQLKPKDLVGIPWRVAFALQADGWWLRQDIIWHKPNTMPESVTDRCTKAHEYVFLMSKSQQYYYDNEAIKERTLTKDNSNRNRDITKLNNTPGRTKMMGLKTNDYDNRNKRSVWTVETQPFKESHFAVFPPDLIKPMVLAGCPTGGVVLDPFVGSGTTAIVAKNLVRNFIGVEINPEYCEMARARIARETAQRTIWQAMAEAKTE
jgi:DNA modification methylase